MVDDCGAKGDIEELENSEFGRLGWVIANEVKKDFFDIKLFGMNSLNKINKKWRNSIYTLSHPYNPKLAMSPNPECQFISLLKRP